MRTEYSGATPVASLIDTPILALSSRHDRPALLRKLDIESDADDDHRQLAWDAPAESSAERPPHPCRTAARVFVVAALLVCPRGVWAAGCPARTDAIAADRPDTTNSSVVVPYGSVQVENGINWAVHEGSHVLDASETRVRLGVAHCGELFVDVPNYFAALNGVASPGLSDFIVSVKRQLFTERRSFSLSAAAGLGFPVGRTGESAHYFTPYVQFPWSLAITDEWSVTGMLTVTWPVAHAADKPDVEPTLTVAREVGLKCDLFVEYVGDYSTRDRPSQVIDVGGGWRITPRQQLDFHIGVGLTRSSPDHYVGVGYSFRLDQLFGGAGNAPTAYPSVHQIMRRAEVSRAE